MEHLYVISYDVTDPKRWRRLFKTMHGFGDWLQYSVFQARLGRIRRIQMEAAINEIVHHEKDHVLILDLGPAENVKPRVSSIGKAFEPVQREPVIV